MADDPRRPRERRGEWALDNATVEASVLDTALNKDARKLNELGQGMSKLFESLKDGRNKPSTRITTPTKPSLSPVDSLQLAAKFLGIERSSTGPTSVPVAAPIISAPTSPIIKPVAPVATRIVPTPRAKSSDELALAELRKLTLITMKQLGLDLGTSFNVYGTNTARVQWQSEKDLQQIIRKNESNTITPSVSSQKNEDRADLQGHPAGMDSGGGKGAPPNYPGGGRGGFGGSGGPPSGGGSGPPGVGGSGANSNQTQSYIRHIPTAPNDPRKGPLHQAISTIASTPMTMQNLAGLAGGAIGGVLGGIAGSFGGPVGIAGGAIAGAEIGKDVADAVVNLAKTPIYLKHELMQAMSAAQPSLEFRTDIATLGRAGGFAPKTLAEHLSPGIMTPGVRPEAPEWMKLYGASAPGVIERLNQFGIAPKSNEEAEKMGQFFYRQEATPEFAGMPQGSVEQLAKTITSTGMAGRKLTEGDNVFSEQYFRKTGDIMAIATEKGMDRVAVLQSINEGIRSSSSGFMADRGMLDLMQKITQTGTAGAGTGQSQKHVAENLTESLQHWTRDPAKWTMLAGPLNDITTKEQWEKITGEDFKQLPDFKKNLLNSFFKEKNLVKKMSESEDIFTPSQLLKMEIQSFRTMNPGAKDSDVSFMLKNRHGITFPEAGALLEKTEHPTEHYKKVFAENNISLEAQKYALGPLGHSGNVTEPALAAALDSSKEFADATTDEERHEIATRIAKGIQRGVSKYGAPIEQVFKDIRGVDSKQAIEKYKANAGQDFDVNKTLAEANQVLLKNSAAALEIFTKAVIAANKELENIAHIPFRGPNEGSVGPDGKIRSGFLVNKRFHHEAPADKSESNNVIALPSRNGIAGPWKNAPQGASGSWRDMSPLAPMTPDVNPGAMKSGDSVIDDGLHGASGTWDDQSKNVMPSLPGNENKDVIPQSNIVPIPPLSWSQTQDDSRSTRLASTIAFFKDHGWSKEQAEGIAANAISESGLNPQAVGDSGKAQGLFQWHPERRKAIEEHFGMPVNQMTFNQQLKAAQWELTEGGEQKAGEAIRKTTSAYDAGRVTSSFFERPRDKQGEAERRGTLAAAIDRVNFDTPVAQLSPSRRYVSDDDIAHNDFVSNILKMFPIPSDPSKLTLKEGRLTDGNDDGSQYTPRLIAPDHGASGTWNDNTTSTPVDGNKQPSSERATHRLLSETNEYAAALKGTTVQPHSEGPLYTPMPQSTGASGTWDDNRAETPTRDTDTPVKGPTFEGVPQDQSSRDTKHAPQSSDQQGHMDLSSGMASASNSAVTFSTHITTACHSVDIFVKKLNAANAALKTTATASNTNAQILKSNL